MTAALPRRLALVTGNRHKLAEALRIVAAAGGGVGDAGAASRSPILELEAVELDLPEIQELDLRTVLTAKAEEAWRRLGRPLVVEDTALELAALGGFPGPLVKWMLAAVGAEGIARVAHALGETRVAARCMLLYRDHGGEVVAEGVTHGRLVTAARGGEGFGWDPVFLPAGGTRTYGELAAAEKDAIGHRGHAWRALLEVLAARGYGS